MKRTHNSNGSQRHAKVSRATLLLLLSVLISSCGFKLRTMPILPEQLNTLSLSCELKANWRLCQNVRNLLQESGVSIRDDAPLELTLGVTEDKQRTYTLASDASAAEYQLIQKVNYQLRDKQSERMLANNTVSSSTVYQHNASSVLAKDRENKALRAQLSEQLAADIIRELSFVKVEPPADE